MNSGARKNTRCAIYTRKSSEEGLEQDFNSLDAQREACGAYVASQASEGWSLLPEHYDDGGISGGTLERPALQRLLDNVRAGRIDIIVVYKVDRLTRSLLDFAKLVEAFDEAEVSFVSVTQAFNTTTSMGRLTLNMLLSFAQFEREVTAERIRDKIAQSKAKGMWMGGTPPIGYEADGRSLAIVDEHAAIVRGIYARYLDLGNVRQVAAALERDGIRSPKRSTQNGREYGGRIFSRGQIYQILRNPIYAGDIAHNETVYLGNHEAIIERKTWEAVQELRASHLRGARKRREASSSLLAGLLFTASGEALIAVHTSKKLESAGEQARKRYRYYVSKSLHARQPTNKEQALPALRIPASEIEQVIKKDLSQLLSDPVSLLGKLNITVTPPLIQQARLGCTQLSEHMGNAIRRKILERVNVHDDCLEIVISAERLAKLLKLVPDEDSTDTFTITRRAQLSRCGHVIKLIDESGTAAVEAPNTTLLALLGKARGWWRQLQSGKISISELAREEDVSASYITRVVRLSFLSPRVIEAILDGSLSTTIEGRTLLATNAVPASWEDQDEQYLAA